MSNQKTIKKEIVVKGFRQSDGLDTFVKFIPTNSGLWVKYRDQIEPISPYIMNSHEAGFTNSVVLGDNVITMVEHIFSAVNGLGIDNIIIEFESDESPFFANAEFFAKVLSENILDIEHTNKEYYRVKRPMEIIGENGQYCKITPHNDFKINITIDFEGIIGKQSLSYSFKQDDYLSEVSYARSILIFEVKDISNPWKDYKKHFDSFPHTLPDKPKESPYITYTDKEFLIPLKDPLEPVRHKLLDFIGDLIFLNKIPLGRFEIYKPGHAFNRKIVETIFNSIDSCDLQFEYFLKKIPEMRDLEKYVENNNVHKNENVLEHTKKVFTNVLQIIIDYDFRLSPEQKFRMLLAVFLHDYGKKDALHKENDGTTSCKNHEYMSVQNIEKESLLSRFDIKNEDKIWILDFIKNHAEMHNMFVDDNDITMKNHDKFKNDHNDHLENLIFSIADIKETYFKTFNKKEYDRRMNILNEKLQHKIT